MMQLMLRPDMQGACIGGESIAALVEKKWQISEHRSGELLRIS